MPEDCYTCRHSNFSFQGLGFWFNYCKLLNTKENPYRIHIESALKRPDICPMNKDKDMTEHEQ